MSEPAPDRPSAPAYLPAPHATDSGPPAPPAPMQRDPERRLVGIELRYVLTDLLDRPPHRMWAVAELVTVLTDAGFDLVAQPSKTVSDALRTEIRRGRAQRVGWGRYRAAPPGSIPGATRRRIRARARARWERLHASRGQSSASRMGPSVNR